MSVSFSTNSPFLIVEKIKFDDGSHTPYSPDSVFFLWLFYNYAGYSEWTHLPSSVSPVSVSFHQEEAIRTDSSLVAIESPICPFEMDSSHEDYEENCRSFNYLVVSEGIIRERRSESCTYQRSNDQLGRPLSIVIYNIMSHMKKCYYNEVV